MKVIQGLTMQFKPHFKSTSPRWFWYNLAHITIFHIVALATQTGIHQICRTKTPEPIWRMHRRKPTRFSRKSICKSFAPRRRRISHLEPANFKILRPQWNKNLFPRYQLTIPHPNYPPKLVARQRPPGRTNTKTLALFSSKNKRARPASTWCVYISA